MDPNNPLADREKSLENQWIKNKECVATPQSPWPATVENEPIANSRIDSRWPKTGLRKLQKGRKIRVKVSRADKQSSERLVPK